LLIVFWRGQEWRAVLFRDRPNTRLIVRNPVGHCHVSDHVSPLFRLLRRQPPLPVDRPRRHPRYTASPSPPPNLLLSLAMVAAAPPTIPTSNLALPPPPSTVAWRCSDAPHCHVMPSAPPPCSATAVGPAHGQSRSSQHARVARSRRCTTSHGEEFP
jgi:hypothetical protein